MELVGVWVWQREEARAMSITWGANRKAAGRMSARSDRVACIPHQPIQVTRAIAQVTLTGAVAVASLFAVTPAAAISCGDLISGKVVLTADLACGIADNAALTLRPGAKLDLAGHQVRCINPVIGTGLRLTGTNARAENGSVTGCLDGVSIEATGGSLRNLVVHDNTRVGISAVADKVSLRDVMVAENGSDGIHLTGDRHKLERVVAVGNSGLGVGIVGDGSSVRWVTTASNNRAGLRLDGSGHKVRRSVTTSNGGVGLFVSGDRNAVDETTSSHNGSYGIDVAGDQNKVKRVVVVEHTEGGLRAAGAGNTLSKSRVATAQFGIGVEMTGSAGRVSTSQVALSGLAGLQVSGDGHRVQRTTALANTGADLADSNPDCATAGGRWSANTFRTATSNPSDCIE
jgi:hypothetical protein